MDEVYMKRFMALRVRSSEVRLERRERDMTAHYGRGAEAYLLLTTRASGALASRAVVDNETAAVLGALGLTRLEKLFTCVRPLFRSASQGARGLLYQEADYRRSSSIYPAADLYWRSAVDETVDACAAKNKTVIPSALSYSVAPVGAVEFLCRAGSLPAVLVAGSETTVLASGYAADAVRVLCWGANLWRTDRDRLQFPEWPGVPTAGGAGVYTAGALRYYAHHSCPYSWETWRHG